MEQKIITGFLDWWESVHVLLITPVLWGVMTILIGFIGAAGWIFSFFPIITIFSDTTPIAPNTSVLFIILGLCTVLPSMAGSDRKGTAAYRILLLFSLFIAILTIIDILSGYPVHIDRILTPAVPETNHTIGHMSLVTAFLFSLLSTGFMLVPWFRNFSRYLGLFITFAGAVMLLGYLYGAPFLYGGNLVPVAFLTTIGFSCSGTGLVLHAKPFTVSSSQAEQSVQRRILHYFIPFIIAVLLLEGWIISYHLHQTDSTLVLMVAIVTLVGIGVTTLLSHFFSRLIATDLDLANIRMKEAENSLQESLARLKISANIAGIGFWTWDFKTDILTWDDRTYEMHRIPAGTPLTIHSWADRIHPEDRPTAEQIQYMKNQEEFHKEFKVILPDSSILYIEGHGKVFSSETGIPERMVGMNWDITSRIRAISEMNRKNDELAAINEELISQDQELKQQYHKLACAHDDIINAQWFTKEIILQAGEGLIVLDTEGKIVTWNRFMEDYTGYSADEVNGAFLTELFPFFKNSEFDSSISRALSGERIFIPDIFLTLPQTGKEGWFTATWAPHKDSTGKIIGIIISAQDITERKRIEERLIQSESILRASQKLAKIGGWEWDLIHKHMFCTEETYAIHEMDPPLNLSGSDEHIALSISCYDEQDREAVLSAFNHCVKEGIPYDLELPFTTLKGNRIWIRTLGQAELEDGVIVKVRGTIMDITREKTFISKIEKERHSLRKILDQMPDGVYMVDKTYHVRYTNPIMINVFGEPADRFCYEYLHNRTSPCPWCQNDKVFRGSSVRWEWKNPQTGKVYDLFDTPYSTPEGEMYKLEFFHEITDLRNAEKKLAETNEYLSRLIQYANVPIIVWGPDQVIRKINYAFEILSGYHKDEVIGQQVSVLFPPEMIGQIFSGFRAAMKKGRIFDYEMPIIRPDGVIIPVIWNAAEVTDDTGILLAIIAQGRDVTRERLLEREKSVAIKQIQRNFAELAILNDGIRNPLMVIGMLSDLKCPEIHDSVTTQIQQIDQFVTQLDKRWIESESVLRFLQKHYSEYQKDLEIKEP